MAIAPTATGCKMPATDDHLDSSEAGLTHRAGAAAHELRICVLTGDPRLPDLTKRNHRYNEEDFATQRAMREAFETLPGTVSSSSTITRRCSSASPTTRRISS
jgi:DNA polymerase III alpha subunit